MDPKEDVFASLDFVNRWMMTNFIQINGIKKKYHKNLFCTQKVKIFSTNVATEILWQENQ
jgi:hypothetical protein